jgi:hypothetical protein
VDAPGKPQPLSTSIGMKQEFLISKETRPILMGNFDLFIPNRIEKSSNPKMVKKHSLDILPSSHSVTANMTQTHHKKTELSEKDIQLINELVDVVSTSTNSSAIKINQNGSKIIIKREIRDPNGISANPNDTFTNEFLGALEKRHDSQLLTSDFVICHNGDSYKKIKTEIHPKEVYSFRQKIFRIPRSKPTRNLQKKRLNLVLTKISGMTQILIRTIT